MVSSALLLLLASAYGDTALARGADAIVPHVTVGGHSREKGGESVRDPSWFVPRGTPRPASYQSQDWGVLRQVTPGTLLQVEERTGRTTKGRLVAVDERTIFLRIGTTDIQRDRGAVLRVMRTDSPARRRALIGLLIGAAGGAVQALTTVETNKGPWALGLGLGWGAIGALVGGVSGHSARTVTILYEAPPPP
jgi:hypothetical protein